MHKNDDTARPFTPDFNASAALSIFMPPIATAGIFNVLFILYIPSAPKICLWSFLVYVSVKGPMPA